MTDQPARETMNAAYDQGVEDGIRQERERIREALLSDGAIRAALFGFERLERTQGAHPGETYETARRKRRDEMEAGIAAALDHIGLGAVEESEK